MTSTTKYGDAVANLPPTSDEPGINRHIDLGTSPRAQRIGGAKLYLLAKLTEIRPYLTGLWIAIVISFAATFVAEHNGGPQLLYALFFGIAFHFLHQQPNCRHGIDFAAKTLLRIAVALLGARLTVAQIAHLGWWPIIVICIAVPATLTAGVLGARLLGRSREEGVIAGGAVAICGASAAVAIAAVLPHNKNNERIALMTVIGVTGLSTLAMIFYPTLAEWLDLTPTQAGLFIGGTIHDVAQVVGAGYTLSAQTGDFATFVKLLRVALLMPVVIVLWLIYRPGGRTAHLGTKPPIPLFLLGFIALVAVNSAGWLPPPIVDGMNRLSRWCLVIAIAALGMKTSFQELARLGWRPIALLIVNTVLLAVLVLGLLSCDRTP